MPLLGGAGCPSNTMSPVTGQLTDMPTRRLPTGGLDKLRTGQPVVSQIPPAVVLVVLIVSLGYVDI